MNNVITDSFKLALYDYLYLRNHGYPPKPSLKLVGDRYRLTAIQRTVLFRGIGSTKQAGERKDKLTRQLKGKSLHMDGYNVCLALVNYLLGKTVFIANDGLLRDVGDGYGKTVNETAFRKAVRLLVEFTAGTGVERVRIYLDEPMPGSASHASLLEEEMQRFNIPGEVCRAPCADQALISNDNGQNVIATSDSQVIDAVQCDIYDAAREVLENKLGIKIPALEHLI
ncbi:MAG: DUF434 domain-containing protein [bacterium]|nr:DUF434 domain-containing protein [bacterium]